MENMAARVYKHNHQSHIPNSETPVTKKNE
jgi:hypothetical protein